MKRYKIPKGVRIWRTEGMEKGRVEMLDTDHEVFYDEHEATEHSSDNGSGYLIVTLPPHAHPWRYLQVYMENVVISYEGV